MLKIGRPFRALGIKKAPKGRLILARGVAPRICFQMPK